MNEFIHNATTTNPNPNPNVTHKATDSQTPLLKRLPINTAGRDFFIGDLHGATAHLMVALQSVQFQEDRDRLFSVGDLIDHGPDSWGAIELLAKPWFHAVLGNHEAMALAYHGELRAWYSRKVWLHNGGGWATFLLAPQVTQMLEALSRLPLALEIPQRDGRVIGLIHGEILDGRGWPALAALQRDQVVADEDRPVNIETGLLWARSQAVVNAFLMRHETLEPDQIKSLLNRHRTLVGLARRTRGIDLLIAGHTITHSHQPFAMENRLSIDTGAYQADGALTLVEPMAGHYFQVRWNRDRTGPRAKAIRRPLPEPIRAWDLRALLRAKRAAMEVPL